MKIRHLLLAFSLLALALGAGIVVLAYALEWTFAEVEIAQQRRHQSFLLADELRQSSDDLTRFARTFVVTRDAKYEQFFNEVLDIRNGSAPRPDGYERIYWDLVVAGVGPGGGRGERSALASRMLAAGFTTEEFSKLREAENRSNELIRIEQVAMNAVKGRFDDGTGGFSIEKSPDFNLAVKLLHGEQYHAAKAAIMQPIGEFTRMMDERTAAALARVDARSEKLMVVILVLGTALVANVAVASLMIYRRLVQPSRRLLAVAQEIAQGSYDVRSGLSSRDEIGELAQGFDHMVERLTESLAQARQATTEVERKTEELTDAYAQIQQELEAAQSLQRAILPKGFPRCAEFTGHALMWPARQLAGDFYDLLELPDGRLGVLIADVSGKGVPAAFFMGISRTVLRSAAREGQSPGTCLAFANDVLCRTNPMELFVTVFYAILDPRDGTFLYANGGHNSPLLVRNGAGAATPLEGTGSLVLGALEGIPYPERSVQLEPGDAVLLYTDGVTEAQNTAGEAFAEERLIRTVGETRGLDPGAMAAHVTEAVRAFSGGAALADDLTCLVLCYAGAAAGS